MSTYKSKLLLVETEVAIKLIKDKFENILAEKLNLTRVSAPLFVRNTAGLNDNLNGVERPVEFNFKSGETGEIVHSLAKWKRYAIEKYDFGVGTGLYCDMNAIRRDEDLTPIHSYYVDQWDWELVIEKKDRNVEFMKTIVELIYETLKEVDLIVRSQYPSLSSKLPEKITFVSSQELEDRYPDATPKEREYNIGKEHGAVFITQVGKDLKSGQKHDSRAPDYDDWELNGDILVYYPVLDISLELSSMGIRVDKASLLKQLKLAKAEERLEYEFHKMLVEGKLPLTIGGGIGQSRICMMLLDKAHVGEVQVSIWDKETLKKCKEQNIYLL